MSAVSKGKLISKLENNKAYREAYVCEHIKTSVPIQIRHLREERTLTQAQLAAMAKTTQTVISRLEDPNYGNLTLNSLLKIAAALDIALLVKFAPFSRMLLEFQDLSPTALSVKAFTDELSLLKAWAEDYASKASNVRKKESEIHHGITQSSPPLSIIGRELRKESRKEFPVSSLRNRYAEDITVADSAATAAINSSHTRQNDTYSKGLLAVS
jgi:transcriptional regulator with XRE-family HTH domain